MTCHLEGVSHGYAVNQALAGRALDAVSLSVERGSCVAVIGPSGAGKTTLLKVLAAGLRPDSGSIALFGSDPWSLPAAKLRSLRSRIGLIHQAPPLPPRQRVVAAVAAGRLGQWSLVKALANLAYPLDIDDVGEALARLDLADKLYSRCDQLSGGQWQRVAIARVLYQRADLILADEPVAAMDPRLASHTLEVLKNEAANRGVTLVASLHAVDLALRHFNRIIGLREGRIVFDREPSAITDRELGDLYANEQLAPDQPSVLSAPVEPLVPGCR